MSKRSDDHVLHIDRKLAQLSPIPSERCIYKVHDRLRNENVKAYEPNIVAIGPYHHGKDKLQPMEEHKLRYLQQLLKRRNETSAERYVKAMKELEERARKFYADPISLDSNKFVEIMLLDSCFIIELLRKNVMTQRRDANDLIFQFGHIRSDLCHDLMVFENQLPFFILMQFFNMTENSGSLKDIVAMSLTLFAWITQGLLLENPTRNLRENDIKHLLGLVHYCCCYPFHSMVSKRYVDIKDTSIKSTTELQEAGIQFKNFNGRSLFDIRFVNETIEIPTLRVEDGTESFLRNLIAYEQYHPDSSWDYFTQYATLMDHLVNSSKDVQILSHHGIINNHLGGNEVVSTMFNNLCNNIIVGWENYSQVYQNVNEHCKRPWNASKASLRRDYFNTPWALISFGAAIVLLLLTVTQTVFSILSVV